MTIVLVTCAIDNYEMNDFISLISMGLIYGMEIFLFECCYKVSVYGKNV